MNDKPAKPSTGPRKSDVSVPKFGSSHKEVFLDRVGRKIVDARKVRGITQAALARALFVPPSVIFWAENGLHNTSLITLAKIAAALEVDMRELLPGNLVPVSPTKNEALGSGEHQGRPSVPMLTRARRSARKALALLSLSRRGRP